MNVQLGHEVELSGAIADKIKAAKAKFQAKFKTLPKWAKVLAIGSGVGLLSPTLSTTLITTAATAIPTALAAGPVASVIFGCRKLKPLIEKRIAAKQAAGQSTAADEKQLAQVSAVAAEPIPDNGPQTPAAAHVTTTAQEAQVSQAVTQSNISKYAPLAAAGVGLLAFLPRK